MTITLSSSDLDDLEYRLQSANENRELCIEACNAITDLRCCNLAVKRDLVWLHRELGKAIDIASVRREEEELCKKKQSLASDS